MARLKADVEDAQAVGFELGIVEVLPRENEDTVIGHLGPDLLGSDWDPGRRRLPCPRCGTNIEYAARGWLRLGAKHLPVSATPGQVRLSATTGMRRAVFVVYLS